MCSVPILVSSADLSQLTAQPRKVARLGVCMRWLISAPRVYALKPGDNAPDCSVPFEDTVREGNDLYKEGNL